MSPDRPDRPSPDLHTETQRARSRAAHCRQPGILDWAMDDSRNGQVRSGIWQATPGLTRSIKGETLEFCHIIEGLVEITSEDGESWTFKAGDSFVMKPGFVGTWKTIETVKKVYVVVS